LFENFFIHCCCDCMWLLRMTVTIKTFLSYLLLSLYAWLNSTTNATILCKSLVKIGPAVSAENILIEIAFCVHVVVRYILSNISGCTGLIFAIFSPYQSALGANDGSVPHSWIRQGTLPWKPNNVAVMADTTCILCSLPDGSTVLFRYYLLGGDTAAPSRLLARLCHAFLVIHVFLVGKLNATIAI